MPRCEGLSDGPCPDRRNDGTVRLGEGDLMLCRKCNVTRHQAWLESTGRTASVSKPQSQLKVKETASNEASALASLSKSQSKTKDTASNEVSVSQPQPQLNSKYIVLNELLSYVSCYRSRSSTECIRRVLLNFYSPEDVSVAKKLLAKEFSSLIKNSALTTERRSSASRPAHDAEIDDIIQLFEELDAQKALEGYVFAAAALDRLPKYAPEEINICAVVDRQIHADGVLGDLKVKVDSLCCVTLLPYLHRLITRN